jgi:type IV pilus assembly protein PilM
MMPWNPIHRYAGLQSSIDPIVVDTANDDSMPFAPRRGFLMNGVPSDPFGVSGARDVEVSFGHAAAIGRAAGAEPSRRPLGFVDVRSEAGLDDAGGSMDDAGDDVVAEVESADESASADVVETEAKVPFYKREIGFGRKKSEPEIATEDEAATEEPDGEHVESVAALAEAPVQDAADGPAAMESDDASETEAEEKVPFFKREISLRKKRGAAAVVATEVATESDAPAEPETAAEEMDGPVAAEQAEDDSMAIQASTEADDEPMAEADDEPAADAVDLSDGDATDHADGADTLQWPEQVAAAEELEAAEQVDDDPISEDSAEAAIPVAAAAAKKPFHKREFGKSRGTKPMSGRGKERRGGRIVGLKIGASQLAAAVVEDQNGRPELIELARTPLEAGIVVDGEIRDPEALTNALRTFFADNKLPTKDVRIGIASNRIGVRTFEIAGVEDGARFDNAVRFKAHEVLPIAGSESVLDYRVLDERQSPTGETTRRILLVVAPRDQVAPYAEAAQQAGLKLAGIDLESLGLLRAFVEPQDASDRKATDTATVVVAIGHEASTLMVSGGGVCEFTRVFDWGGGTMQDAIAQELDVRSAEAATILRHLSLAGNSARIEGLDEDARNKAVEAVRLRLTPFARELVSSLQFYQTQPDSLGIGEIVITGGASQLDGLADALHQMIGVAVRVGDPLQRVAARRGVETGFENVIGSLSVAIGLGIEDGAIRSVNLMPGDLAKVSTRKPLKLAPVLLPIAAIVPLAAVGYMFFQAHAKVSDRQSQVATLNAEFASLPVPKLPQIDAALQGLQAQRATAVAQVLGARTAWDSMLTDFARVLPANVWLTSLSAKTSHPLTVPIAVAATGATGTAPAAAPATTTAVGPTGVTIDGYTYSQPDVAELLARLSALPSLQNVQLQGSSVAQVGKRNVVQFTILADVRETGGAS